VLSSLGPAGHSSESRPLPSNSEGILTPKLFAYLRPGFVYAANVFPSLDLLEKRAIIQIFPCFRVYPNITISSSKLRSPDVTENISPLLPLLPPCICWCYSQGETMFSATLPTPKAPRFLLVFLPAHYSPSLSSMLEQPTIGCSPSDSAALSSMPNIPHSCFSEAAPMSRKREMLRAALDTWLGFSPERAES
jgi:hypothetical protein